MKEVVRYRGKSNKRFYEVKPVIIECKTQRVQLLWQKSLYQKVKEIAQQNNTSVNDLVHCVLEAFVEGTE